MLVDRILTTEDGTRLLTEDGAYLQADGYQATADRPVTPTGLSFDRAAGIVSCERVDFAFQYDFYEGQGPLSERTLAGSHQEDGSAPAVQLTPMADTDFRTFQVKATDDYTGLDSAPSPALRVAGPRRKHNR